MQDTNGAGTISRRQRRLSEALRKERLAGIALNPGPSLFYLTGLQFHLMERPVVAIFTPETPPALVLPELEAGKLAALDFEVSSFPYPEDPAAWGKAFRQAVEATGIDGGNVAVEPRRLRVLELRFLEATAPDASFVSDETVIAGLRQQKDGLEIASMRKAVDVAQRAVREALATVREGMTERELAAELVLQMLRAGSESELPFAPIVSFGPNSANPHANPTDRKLRHGDLVLLDWGAAVDGYFSDLTRVYAFGEVDPELAHLAEVVDQARARALAAAGPGVPAGDVDRAARKVIEEAGYGDFFIHRTGHGLGMEGHEEPYIRGDNAQPLQPGMTFTIEPGIYLPDRGGVRIEDDVLVTQNGAESLSDLPRALTAIG